MKKNRITQLADPPMDRAQADAVYGRLNTALLRQQEIQGLIDAAALEVRKEHEQELAELAATVDTLKATIKTWSKAVRDSLFPKGSKTLVMTHGSVSFRTGQPTVGFLEGHDEESAIKAFQAMRESVQARFLRVVVVLNREAIIAHRRRKKFLRKRGVKVTQSERFHIDPDLRSEIPKLKEAA